MKKSHIGSSFDEFLKSEGIHEKATAHALKRVLAWQIEHGGGKSVQERDGAPDENKPRPA